jgi:hypothetical protein
MDKERRLKERWQQTFFEKMYDHFLQVKRRCDLADLRDSLATRWVDVSR